MADATHSGQTVAEGIHIVHAFEVADVTARDALSLVAGDVGKIVKVASPLNYYLIISQSAGVGTYARIPGIDYVTAVQAANLTLTTVTPGTDATDLIVTLGVGTWVVETVAVWQNGATGVDGYRSDFTFDGTVTSSLRGMVEHDAIALGLSNVGAAENNLGDDFPTGGVTSRVFVQVQHLAIVVSASGVLTYRAAKFIDDFADTIFRANSYMIARREP